MTERILRDKSWNPFVGCLFDCIYCKPSFKRPVAIYGRENDCSGCLYYTPHYHPERLRSIPTDKVIVVCEDSDISFCSKSFLLKVLQKMRADNREGRVFLLQSKNPSCFEQYLPYLPKNTFLLTTLETNRDYPNSISKAPKPSERFVAFKKLEWKNSLTGMENKIVNIEPIMDFDLDVFVDWLVQIKPLVVFIGFNSHPEYVRLPEPSMEKTLKLIDALHENRIAVMPQDLRQHPTHYAYRNFFEA